jgi:hypothetical protein
MWKLKCWSSRALCDVLASCIGDAFSVMAPLVYGTCITATFRQSKDLVNYQCTEGRPHPDYTNFHCTIAYKKTRGSTESRKSRIFRERHRLVLISIPSLSVGYVQYLALKLLPDQPL